MPAGSVHGFLNDIIKESMVGRDSNRSSGDQLTPTNFNAAIGPSPAQRRVAIIKESHNLHTPQ